ncbi:histidine kinase [Moheibacter lacus]|uniref:ATP-binding protein n=1 Tax=Moheibacter lacus TaxID=2745851 RepID=A0A838ZTM9_9FLAO|nr:ATP-binding protein [Moheibacter lacus]MBA5630337.1 ATP-binding protein [Moheibacter lacus]
MRLNSINNTFSSFQSLITFYQFNKDKSFQDVHLELSFFFAANMSSALGAILDLLIDDFNDIHFDYITPRVEQILLKNDFLSYYGKHRETDFNNTTIKYQKLKPTDGKFFKKYVLEELIDGHQNDLPQMTEGAKDKIIEAIYEIFVNAQIHSESEFIYTCGQFFPIKNTIEFTVVDVGIGFKEKVNRRFGSNLSSVNAIKWAVEDKNTTKQGITGGIGLAILKEFVTLNKGKMQIISGDGFYQYGQNGIETAVFNGEFPGTIVNLQFKTNDLTNYSLVSEVNINDIF